MARSFISAGDFRASGNDNLVGRSGHVRLRARRALNLPRRIGGHWRRKLLAAMLATAVNGDAELLVNPAATRA